MSIRSRLTEFLRSTGHGFPSLPVNALVRANSESAVISVRLLRTACPAI